MTATRHDMAPNSRPIRACLPITPPQHSPIVEWITSLTPNRSLANRDARSPVGYVVGECPDLAVMPSSNARYSTSPPNLRAGLTAPPKPSATGLPSFGARRPPCRISSARSARNHQPARDHSSSEGGGSGAGEGPGGGPVWRSGDASSHMPRPLWQETSSVRSTRFGGSGWAGVR